MNDKLLEIFAVESREVLEALEKGLMDLEAGAMPEQLNAVFRAAHTMKGNAGIVGFSDVVDLTHLMEGLLDQARQGALVPGEDLVGLMLAAVDELRVMVEERLAGREPPRPEHIIAALKGFQNQGASPVAAVKEKPPLARPGQERLYHLLIRLDPGVLATGNDPLLLLEELEELGRIERVTCLVDRLPPLSQLNPQTLYLGWEVWLRSAHPQSTLENVFLFVSDGGRVSVEPVDRLPAGPPLEPGPPAPQPAPWPAREPVPASATIRVDTRKLDDLVNLVGELVIGVARVSQITGDEQSGEALCNAVEDLDLISRDLREQVMRVRMVPVEATFQRFQRVVRDLSRELGKHIRLQMSGTETELDKNVIESIVDPLQHLIRNSADHGLEPPEVRRSLGKPETGTIELRALQQEGRIIIEVADDGRGISREQVLAKAQEGGLLPAGARPGDAEVFSLLFHPGFSTAGAVTELSGRGVGLDVVRRNIENLHGSVEVVSAPGQGATFRIRLPLTLAIIEGMTVSLGREIFTLPMLSIEESFRPTAQDVKTVEGRGELIHLRGEHLPLVRLHRLLDLPARRTDPTRALVVIIQSVSRRFGLLVDDILGEQQAVIKSLEQNYCKVEGVAGATILGDGRVSLILDIHGLEKMAFSGRSPWQGSAERAE